MAKAGRDLRIHISTDDGATWNPVGGLKSGSMSCSAGTVDVSEFGSQWVTRILGLRDASYSLGGHWKPSDAQQVAIKAAFIAGEGIKVRFLPDGENGFEHEVVIPSFEINGAVEGAQEMSMEFEGNGTMTEVVAA